MSIGTSFKVTNTGKLYASGVDLSGIIKASGGNIGGIAIGNGISGTGWSLKSDGSWFSKLSVGDNDYTE
jgi:hypothetical protein